MAEKSDFDAVILEAKVDALKEVIEDLRKDKYISPKNEYQRSYNTTINGAIGIVEDKIEELNL